MAETQTTKSVPFMLNTQKPFPDWLKNHRVFKEMSVNKVFPKFGLPNFREKVEIVNTTEATNAATNLGYAIQNHMSRLVNNLYAVLDKAVNSADEDRNEKCAALQCEIALTNGMLRELAKNDFVHTQEGKISLRLARDVFGTDKNPAFRKGERITSIYGKFVEIAEKNKIGNFPKLDSIEEFKTFSRVNVPKQKYNVVFSSVGEDGAWDIATISMRGVTSCQSWNAPQSRGLIGSVSSKFVGVIYLESDEMVPGFGSKMLNRALVRFAINKKTKKPAIVLDKLYPNHNKGTAETFIRILSEKSGLPVVTPFAPSNGGIDNSIAQQYYIPNEPARKLYMQGEAPYMDYGIPIETHAPKISNIISSGITNLTFDFKKKVAEDIANMVKVQKNLYLEAEALLTKNLEEYNKAKEVWENANAKKPEAERTPFNMEEPSMDAALKAFGRGGVINLLNHCDKRHGENSAGKLFANYILDSIPMPEPEACASKEEFHRKFLMNFFKNSQKIKEESRQKMRTGTWSKSFPKSAERFMDFILSKMKGYVLASSREMIKAMN